MKLKQRDFFVKLKRETRSLSRSSALAIDSAVAPMNDLAQLAELHLTLSSATAESQPFRAARTIVSVSDYFSPSQPTTFPICRLLGEKLAQPRGDAQT